MEPHEPTFERLGRYELLRKIATGGMAELFLARFTGPGGFEKRCAVKRILPQYATDAEFQRMFLNEARVAALFDHPNIVQIFDMGVDDSTGQTFIAMELINGLDLRQLLRISREQGMDVPPELAAYMMAQALDGLAYAHEFRDTDGIPLRVVHRDVSPQNILVSFEGALKLVDFGIVKVSSNENHTQTGLLKGKIAYISPEAAAGEPIDGRADVFAIGVCLYELITGVKPFRGTTELMTLKAILEQEPQPITSFVPECPIGIEAAITRALAKRPNDRFDSARAFQVELLTVLRSCPVPLDRHVLSQFVRSVTESETSRFDTSQLRIPRHVGGTMAGTTPGPRFAGGNTAQADEAWRAEAAMAFRSALDSGKPRPAGPPSVFRPVPPGSPGEASPMAAPIPAVNTDSGVFSRSGLDQAADADVARAAGVGRNPQMLLIVALAAAVLALGVAWLVTSPTPTEITPLAASPAASAAASSPPSPAAALAAPGAPSPAPPSTAPSPAAPSPVVTASPEPAETREPRREERREERASERRRRPEPRSDGTTGRLTLATTPRGLNVTLNGKSLGRTPLDGVEIPAGKHTLTVSSPQFGIARALPVEIKAGALTTQTLSVPRGKITVNARPYADVYVDGEKVGTTPLTRPVYEGRHEVKLVSSQGGEQIRIVDVSADQDVTVNVKF